MMRIGMVVHGGFPPDIRIEKEIHTLSREHHCFVLCARRGGQPIADRWEGAEITRVFSPLDRRLAKASLMVRQRSTAWERCIAEFSDQNRVDVLHVHDLPLLGSALKVAARCGIPVVADLHENYPAMLEDAKRVPVRGLVSLGSAVARMLISVPRWERYELQTVPRADQVITVIEEASERLWDHGVSADRITVVGNYASLDAVPQHLPDLAAFNLIYAGSFGPTRDLGTVIDAVGSLPPGEFPDLRVELIGGVGREAEKVRAQADPVRIRVRDWIPREEAEALMSNATVGLVPHRKSAHTDATIPHKLFQYMWRGLPVIVSNCRPLQRIVEGSACGLVYEAGNPRSLARAIATLYNNRDRIGAYGGAGREAVRTRYNWDAAGENLLAVYRNLATSR